MKIQPVKKSHLIKAIRNLLAELPYVIDAYSCECVYFEEFKECIHQNAAFLLEMADPDGSDS